MLYVYICLKIWIKKHSGEAYSRLRLVSLVYLPPRGTTPGTVTNGPFLNTQRDTGEHLLQGLEENKAGYRLSSDCEVWTISSGGI